MYEKQKILVVCDPDLLDSDHNLQITSKARTLADEYGGIVTAVCIGRDDPRAYKALGCCGADTVVVCSQREALQTWALADIVGAVMSSVEPHVVLFPATDACKAIAAMLSARFGAGLTADCIDINASKEGGVVFTRAAINDSVVAKIRCINCLVQMCTIKKDVFTKTEQKARSLTRIEYLTYKPINRNGWVYEVISSMRRLTSKSVDISQYPIVFCVGRGVRDSLTRDRIEALAKGCGAGLVGTRAAVEERLVEKGRQVGQSGKSISPRVYVGFGVSGASQHMVGIKNAGHIIAINNDERAAIMDYADYPILDDITNVISEMELAIFGHAAAA